MEAFGALALPLNKSSAAVASFLVDDDGELTISLGSYSFSEYQLLSTKFWLGRFNSEQGIGSEAD